MAVATMDSAVGREPDRHGSLFHRATEDRGQGNRGGALAHPLLAPFASPAAGARTAAGAKIRACGRSEPVGPGEEAPMRPKRMPAGAPAARAAASNLPNLGWLALRPPGPPGYGWLRKPT